jgi:hypothetical protein
VRSPRAATLPVQLQQAMSPRADSPQAKLKLASSWLALQPALQHARSLALSSRQSWALAWWLHWSPHLPARPLPTSWPGQARAQAP